jgi:hypothetical protein
MLYVFIAALALVLGVFLVRAFVNADPARLAETLTGVALALGATAAALCFGIGIFAREPPLMLAGAAGFVVLGVAVRRYQARRPAETARASTVTTEHLSMRLEHDTGTMSGTVLRGRFQGRSLASLGRDEVIELWRGCQAEDAQSASLLEAYLDRLMPDWRAAERTAGQAPRGGAEAMTREEAYQVLGLQPGADEEQIRAAHRRLMMLLHPDHGGTSYLAAKLNRAREVLLGAWRPGTGGTSGV